MAFDLGLNGLLHTESVSDIGFVDERLSLFFNKTSKKLYRS